MPYRDDLEAAHIRITELEADLEQAQRRGDDLRGELVKQGRRRPWGWLAIGGIATLVLVGSGAGQVLHAQNRDERSAQRRVASLEVQLRAAEMEASEAKEESRLAFEMMAQNNDRRQKGAAEIGEATPYEAMREAMDSVARTNDARDATDASDETAPPPTFLYVVTDRPARVGVDSSSVYEWTPARVPIRPGQHHISVIADDGRVRRNTVNARSGQTTNLTVHFDH